MDNKVIEPVNEKYAGVIIDKEVLPFVSKIIASRLRKYGYNVPCEYYYDYDGTLKKGSCHYDHNTSTSIDDNTLSAPRLHEVKEWLKTKGVIINVFSSTEKKLKEDGVHYDYVTTNEWKRTIYVNENGKYIQHKHPIKSFKSEFDALAIAIREGLNCLKKE